MSERVAMVRRSRSIGEWTMEPCRVEAEKDKDMRKPSVYSTSEKVDQKIWEGEVVGTCWVTALFFFLKKKKKTRDV